MFKIKHYIVAVATVCLSLTVAAQTETSTGTADVKADAPSPAQESNAKKGAEKITVTGSHIKRIQVEGPTPVQVLDREHLDKSGHNSISDVLRDISASSFGGSREDAGSSVADVATVNLRGLGAERTLVLMNGRRLPKDSLARAVDLNNIPFAAVERVEILKDGASALYGSDAVGGVVNIITKKDFEGLTFSTSGVFNTQDFGERFEAGSRVSGAVTHGFANDKMNVVTVLNYRKNEGLFSRERDYTATGESTIGDIPSTSSDGGATWSSPGCPADRLSDEGFCIFNFADFSSALPALEQYSLMSEGTVNLTPVTDLIVRGSFTHKKSSYVFAPAPGIFDVGADRVRYRVMELGNRGSDFKTNAGSLMVGVKTEVLSDWEVTADVSYNVIDREEKNVGYAKKDAFADLIDNGDFDPSAPSGSRIVNQAAFDAAKTTPFQNSGSTLLSINSLITGELTENISLAFGTTITKDDFEVEVDKESAAGNVFSSGGGNNSDGDRQIISAFAEFGYMPTDTLEIQFAARFDNYDDFGSSVNPKLAVRYQPVNSLMLRSSIGTGFKAPDLQDLYGNGSFGFPSFIDKVYCDQEGGNDPNNRACQPQQYFVNAPTNKDLEEGKFWSANIGAVYQMNKNHSIGIDLFYLNMKNVVAVDYEAITQAELDGIDVSRVLGAAPDRDGSGRLTDTNGIFAPTLNLGSLEQLGLDIALDNKVRLSESGGLFDFKTNISYLIDYEFEKFPGLGLEDTLEEPGRPRLRGSLAVTYIPVSLPLNTSVTARYIGKHECEVKEICERKEYLEYDMQAVYKTKKIGDISIGVQNILDTTPPLDTSDVNNQLEGNLYNTRGRTVYLGYKYTF